jgi:hypothetical protein
VLRPKRNINIPRAGTLNLSTTTASVTIHNYPITPPSKNLQLLVLSIKQYIARLNRAFIIIVDTAVSTDIRSDRTSVLQKVPARIAGSFPCTDTAEVAISADLEAAGDSAGAAFCGDRECDVQQGEECGEP